MRKWSTRRTVSVLVLGAGVIAIAISQLNAYAQMDRADQTGTSGNIFDPGILPLGILGLIAAVTGAVLIGTERRRATPPKTS